MDSADDNFDDKKGNEDDTSDDDNSEDVDDGDDNDDDDAEMKVVDVEMKEVLVGSPSPEKRRDMVLRSGRRKRRRSKETTGFTPPEELKTAKKARPTTERKSRTAENGQEMTAITKPLPASAVTTIQVTSGSLRTTIKTGRESLLATDPEALATAQDPEMYATDGILEPPDGESSRRLFRNQAIDVVVVANETMIVSGIAPVHPEPKVPEPENTMNGNHTVTAKPTRSLLNSGFFWRITFMMLLALPFYMLVHPLCVTLANIVIPLRELKLPEQAMNKSALEALDEPPSAFLHSIDTLNRVHVRASHKMETLQKSRHLLEESVEELTLIIKKKKAILERAALMDQAEAFLFAALENHDVLDSSAWQQARESLRTLGRTLLDTPSIQLWRVVAPEGCAEALEKIAVARDRNDSNSSLQLMNITNPPLQASDMESLFHVWLNRTQSSSTKFMKSVEAQELVRNWIKLQIQNTLQGDQQMGERIADLVDTSKKEFTKDDKQSLSMTEIEDIIQDRLSIELADRTGEYDHAAIHNGARIIRQGKRATSKSLIDSLPLGNRLLQLSQLQFYGFGPEAAITPTYPSNALGQCWSFQQAPIKDLIKRRHDRGGGDDHKSGNFGTLTIRLPTPVAVRSVVIEHPPKGVTDQRSSAIRAFRVVGYGDAEAMTKPWSLGSFEYDIGTFFSTLIYFRLSVLSPAISYHRLMFFL